MRIPCSLTIIVFSWLNAAGHVCASSIELDLPGTSTQVSKGNGNVNLTAQPAIDPNFNVRQVFGRDKINALHACLNAVQAARELALRPDSGRIPENDYSYDGSRDVTIHIRGWPSRPIQKRYALWGLVSSLGALVSNQQRINSGKFTLRMGSRPVGQIAYVGPNTPSTVEVDPTLSNMTTFDIDRDNDAEAVDLSFVNDTTQNPLTDDRPGELEIFPLWLGANIGLKDFFVATLGAIVYAGGGQIDDMAPSFDMNVRGYGVCIWIQPKEETEVAFRNRDAVEAVTKLVFEAVAGSIFEEVKVMVKWKQVGGVVVDIAKIWVYVKPPGGCVEISGLNPFEDAPLHTEH